jgi:hypothetical protein
MFLICCGLSGWFLFDCLSCFLRNSSVTWDMYNI